MKDLKRFALARFTIRQLEISGFALALLAAEIGACPPAALAQVKLIAHTSATNTSNGTGTIDTTGANFFAVCEAGPYGPVPPTDSVSSNKYSLVANAPNPGYWSIYLYVSYNPTTSHAEKWVVNQGGYPATVEAYSGVAGLDKTAVANAKVPLIVPPIVPANPNELIQSCFTPQGAAAPLTTIDTTGGGSGIAAAYQVQTAPTPVSVRWTEPNGNQQSNAALTASFFSTLTPAPLTVTTKSLPEAFAGAAYSFQLTANGGTAPLRWTGSVPSGLTLSPDGLLSGTLSSASSSIPIALTVTDGKGIATPFHATLTIASTPITISTNRCPDGHQYKPYRGCKIVAAGGTPPLTFSWAGAIPWTGQLPPANGNYAALPEGLSESPAGEITGVVKGQGVYTVLITVTDAAGATATKPVIFAVGGDNSMAGCSYPADSIYYLNVADLPVDTSPAAPIFSDYVHASIRAGFGQYGNGPNGIPFLRVPYNQPMVPVTADVYNGLPGSRAPLPPDAPMEGTRNGVKPSPVQDYSGDNHVLILQTAGPSSGCKEYNLYQVYNNPDGSWGDGLGDGKPGYSAGFWDMTKYTLTPQGETAADAGGMPMIPFLENYDEVLGTGRPGAENGVIREPKRFTLNHTLRGYVWPATHQAGVGGCTGGFSDKGGHGLLSQIEPPTSCTMTGPLGEIYRLKANTPTPDCAASSPQARIIIQGFRDHGIILADNGLSGALIGTPDPRWNMNDLACLSQLHLTDFEPVKVQQQAVSWPTSSQVKCSSCGR